MKFEEGKYYSHRNFLDVYIKILTNLDDESLYISWYNKNWNKGKFFIGTDMIKVKKEYYNNWSEKYVD